MTDILQKYIEAIDFEISGGEPFMWSCFGPHTRFLNGDSDIAGCSALFDPQTQEVFAIEVQHNDDPIYYRWITPEYVEAYKAEAKSRGVDWQRPGDDGTKWRDTDCVLDVLEKVRAIRLGIPYDPNVIMTVTLDRDVFCDLAMLAHERNQTLNQCFVEVLTQQITIAKEAWDEEQKRKKKRKKKKK